MTEQARPAATDWTYPEPYSMRFVATIAAVLLLLGATGHRVGIDRLFASSPTGSDGIAALATRFIPPQLSERRAIGSLPGFDATNLPPFAYLERVDAIEDRLDPETMAMTRSRTTKIFLVEPTGYLSRVVVKIFETLEIALWGTALALLIGLPLALLGARGTISPPLLGGAIRAITAMLRALPELISALLLVAVYGFGPIAGVLALGLHGAGFLGKFFAEEIENADRKPQDALTAIGAGRFAVWRLAILPQVLPQYVGYTAYMLDRNVRMATVIGLVGAGGIGQELKGRFDMYEYQRVGTIIIAIFAVVIALDVLSAQLRKRLM